MSKPPIEGESRSLGRARLVSQLRKRGMSRRRSVQVLNFLLDQIKQALAQDEEVEFPFGKLKRVKEHFSDWWDHVDDWPADRQPYTVEWELDEAGWRLLYGPDPAADRPRKKRGGMRRSGK